MGGLVLPELWMDSGDIEHIHSYIEPFIGLENSQKNEDPARTPNSPYIPDFTAPLASQKPA